MWEFLKRISGLSSSDGDEEEKDLGPIKNNGYVLFLKDMMAKCGHKNAVDLVEKGLNAWNKLSKEERNKYVVRSKMLKAPLCCPCASLPSCPSGVPALSSCPSASPSRSRGACRRPKKTVVRRKRCMKPGPVTSNGYLNYMRSYRRKHCNATAQEAIREGAKNWCLMTQAQKNRYKRMACKVTTSQRRRNTPLCREVLAKMNKCAPQPQRKAKKPACQQKAKKPACQQKAKKPACQQKATYKAPRKPAVKSKAPKKTDQRVRCQRPGPVTNNGYLNFLRSFRRSHCGYGPYEMLVKASRVWRRMPQNKKNRYNRMACKVTTNAKRLNSPFCIKARAGRKRNLPGSCSPPRPAAGRCPGKAIRRPRCPIVRKRQMVAGKSCNQGPVTSNGFLNFMRKFRKDNCGLSSNQMVMEGAKAWCGMSNRQKRPFNTMACKLAKSDRVQQRPLCRKVLSAQRKASEMQCSSGSVQSRCSSKPRRALSSSSTTSAGRLARKILARRKKCIRPGPITNNGYLNFLRSYRRKHCNLSGAEAIMLGSVEWCSLSSSKRNRFKRLARQISQTESVLKKPLDKRRRKRRSRSRPCPAPCPLPRGPALPKKPRFKPRPRKVKRKSCAFRQRNKGFPQKYTSRYKRWACQRPGRVTNNGYLNFLRTFRRRNCGLSPNAMVMQGAKAWCRMSPRKQDRYNKMACKYTKNPVTRSSSLCRKSSC